MGQGPREQYGGRFARGVVCDRRNDSGCVVEIPLPFKGFSSRKIIRPELSPNRRAGHASVSTYGRTFDAQLEELRDAGWIKMYREKVMGANNDWREVPKMLDHLAPGERG